MTRFFVIGTKTHRSFMRNIKKFTTTVAFMDYR